LEKLQTAVDFITGLKNTLSEFRSNVDEFEIVYDFTIKVCPKFNIKIPKLRKWTISRIVDPDENAQHIAESYTEENKYSCYFVTLDEMLNGLNSRFNQETLHIISAVGNLMNRTKIIIHARFSKTYVINIDEIKSEIRLKNIPSTELP
jgi:hypothetical protein